MEFSNDKLAGEATVNLDQGAFEIVPRGQALIVQASGYASEAAFIRCSGSTFK